MADQAESIKGTQTWRRDDPIDESVESVACFDDCCDYRVQFAGGRCVALDVLDCVGPLLSAGYSLDMYQWCTSQWYSRRKVVPLDSWSVRYDTVVVIWVVLSHSKSLTSTSAATIPVRLVDAGTIEALAHGLADDSHVVKRLASKVEQ